MEIKRVAAISYPFSLRGHIKLQFKPNSTYILNDYILSQYCNIFIRISVINLVV